MYGKKFFAKLREISHKGIVKHKRVNVLRARTTTGQPPDRSDQRLLSLVNDVPVNDRQQDSGVADLDGIDGKDVVR